MATAQMDIERITRAATAFDDTFERFNVQARLSLEAFERFHRAMQKYLKGARYRRHYETIGRLRRAGKIKS